jgi:hypothetical protein
MQTQESGPHSPRSVLSDLSIEGSSASSLSSTSSHARQQEQQQQGNPAVLFPWKLHEMLQNSLSESKDNVVSWLPEGRAFKVHNVPVFVHDILPQYFKQTKYKSFQRQLNLWGFERLTSGPMKGAYFHPSFLRDHPDWCKHLTRQRAKKSGSPVLVAVAAPSSPTATSKAQSKPTKSARSMLRRPIVVPSAAAAGGGGSTVLMPRKVSEASLESFGELLRELDTTATSSTGSDMTLDLAEFEGFTFHLLEEERYEELNLEFKFQESNINDNILPVTDHPEEAEGATSVHALLQELEQGTFGTPKTSFDYGAAASMATGVCAM